MDWGKYRYDQQKREREARKKQHTIDLKEVKLRPITDEHDLGFKLRNIRRFLHKGKNVKVTVRFRRGELRRPELGQNLLDRVIDEVGDAATVRSRSRVIDARQLSLLLEPVR